MSLTPEVRDAVLNELKRIGGQLNLSDEQKERLHGFMTEASEKVQQYKQQNPNASPADVIKKVAEAASFQEPAEIGGFLRMQSDSADDNMQIFATVKTW